MDQYRHMLYRYSTGLGPNMNVDLPKNGTDYASFKMQPLIPTLRSSETLVDLKLEADRASMQAEAAEQIIKVMGYNSAAGKNYRELKARVDLIRHLMTNYPIKYVKQEDLNKLYKMYVENSPGMDAIIQGVVKYNQNVSDVSAFVETAQRVRKGYPVFDQFGKKLSAKEAKALAGLEAIKSNPLLLAGLALTAYALWKANK